MAFLSVTSRLVMMSTAVTRRRLFAVLVFVIAVIVGSAVVFFVGITLFAIPIVVSSSAAIGISFARLFAVIALRWLFVVLFVTKTEEKKKKNFYFHFPSSESSMKLTAFCSSCRNLTQVMIDSSYVSSRDLSSFHVCRRTSIEILNFLNDSATSIFPSRCYCCLYC